MTAISVRGWYWLVGLGCAGLIAAASSTYVHLQMLGDPGYTSFCDVNATVSCTQVYQSRYGAIFGVPVALGGVVWFVGTLLLTLALARAPASSSAHVAGYLLVWSTLGLAVAMYMAYASFFVLQTVCLLCVVVYVAVVGIFLVAGSTAATPTSRLPAAALHDLGVLARRPLGLALLLAFIVGSVGSMVWIAEPSAPATASASPSPVSPSPASPPPVPTAGQRTEFERFWESQPRVSIEVPVPDDESAMVTVLKFNDFQCPACASAHAAYEPVFLKYESSHPGAVRQVLLDFPLDPECNEGTPNGLHTGACEAAVAVRLAAEVGPAAREEMEEWLYANQSGLSRDTVVGALDRLVGVEPARFDARYADVLEAVQADIARGNALPVEATPTYVINGVVVKGSLAPQYFDAAIAYELEVAQQSRAE